MISLEPHKEIVESDLYFISSRLKEMDSSYFIVRDHQLSAWEVHSTKNHYNNTKCFTVPHKELDARTLTYASRLYAEHSFLG